MVDTHTGKSYEHRRQWIVDRIKLLADIFAIDICSYAVLHNHYHAILHVDTQLAAVRREREVIERWERLFSLPVIVQRYLAKKQSATETPEQSEYTFIKERTHQFTQNPGATDKSITARITWTSTLNKPHPESRAFAC
jgi:hypothetical protein